MQGIALSRCACSSRSAAVATCQSSTVVNKRDCKGRDPFDLIDEIEAGPDARRDSGPPGQIGMRHDFLGTYDLFAMHS